MRDNSKHLVDSAFGQSRAFSLNDKLVNPEAVRYLSNVRQEALRTNVSKKKQYTKYKASLYDDEEEETSKVVVLNNNPPPSEVFADFRLRMDKWLEWFIDTKQIVNENSDVFQGYDGTTMDLLLLYLRRYLSGLPEQKGIVLHLLSILKEAPNIKEDSSLEIDEQWAISTVKKLKNKKIKSIDDIKINIQELNREIPVGFKQWYQYLQEHEPTHTAFTSTINARNIWILVQYMNQEWLKDMMKCKRPPQSIRLSNWLLYILYHLPVNLTAESVSSIRELGKKCRKVIEEDAVKAASEEAKIKIPALQINLPSEMANLGISSAPCDLNIVGLTLAVIASIYRQRDLVDWV
ncbi:hypothetical protein HG535_0A02370 [Zygotorulaspora mrakii]|uniref:Pre-mRNA-splicing factor BRR1 n=1 Tax=Zygotorulaspora mrakii TaxID=42260 RepID=A0A7H9AWY9_ZYGMR|nr:uncharacterized protein HG535_0A02370 [Zygotorulaspora mrakii]QLG70299.1 hypothetical protein HG535_0A02370 [Zygotorulaspora mrakii]